MTHRSHGKVETGLGGRDRHGTPNPASGPEKRTAGDCRTALQVDPTTLTRTGGSRVCGRRARAGSRATNLSGSTGASGRHRSGPVRPAAVVRRGSVPMAEPVVSVSVPAVQLRVARPVPVTTTTAGASTSSPCRAPGRAPSRRE